MTGRIMSTHLSEVLRRKAPQDDRAFLLMRAFLLKLVRYSGVERNGAALFSLCKPFKKRLTNCLLQFDWQLLSIRSQIEHVKRGFAFGIDQSNFNVALQLRQCLSDDVKQPGYIASDNFKY